MYYNTYEVKPFGKVPEQYEVFHVTPGPYHRPEKNRLFQGTILECEAYIRLHKQGFI